MKIKNMNIRLLKQICFFLIILLLFLLNGNESYATTCTADQAINYLWSIEGTPIGECVHLATKYATYIGGFLPHIEEGANMWTYTDPLPSGWQRIQGATPQKGDILLYDGPVYGHVAIFESYDVTWHSNYGSENCRRIVGVPYMNAKAASDWYWGVIRPDFISDTQPPVVEWVRVCVYDMQPTMYRIEAKVTDNVGVTSVRFPTWTDGQTGNDAIWHDAIYDSNDGLWKYVVQIKDHGNYKGVYHTHVYAYDAAGKEGTSKYIENTLVGEGPLDLGTFTARIMAKGNNNIVLGSQQNSEYSDIKDIVLQNKNYSDDSQLWKFEKQSGGNYYRIKNVSTGLYMHVHAGADENGRQIFSYEYQNENAQLYFIMNYNGGYRLVPALTYNMKALDLGSHTYEIGTKTLLWGIENNNHDLQTVQFDKDEEPPVITTAKVDINSVTSDSYKVMAKGISDNRGVKRVAVASWTDKEVNGNSQDDVRWDDMTYNSSTGWWEYTVKASDHNNEKGLYHSHVYVFDTSENHSHIRLMYLDMGSSHANEGNSFTGLIHIGGSKDYCIGVNGTALGSNCVLKKTSDSNNDDSVLWNFEKISGTNKYRITHVKSGLRLGAFSGENLQDLEFEQDKNPIQYVGLVKKDDNSNAQQWYIMTYNGGYRLVCDCSWNMRGLDVVGGNMQENTKIQLFRTYDEVNKYQTITFNKNVPITGITLNKTSLNLYKKNEYRTENFEFQLIATINPANTSMDKTVLWSSSNTKVATVDANGKVVAVGKGTATITAACKADSTKKATCTVTVTNPIQYIQLNHEYDFPMYVGDTFQFKVTSFYPEDADDKRIKWTVLGDSDLATIDSNGFFKALKPATTIIVRAQSLADPEVSGDCHVTIYEKTTHITGLTLNKTSLTLKNGSSETLKATLSPADTTDDKTVLWSSNNTSVATVDSNGKVTCKACEGTATITAKSKTDTTKQATCVITAGGHTWDNGKVTKEATCTASGEKTYTCKNNSSHTKTEEISALGHTITKVPFVKPTYEKEGNIEHYKCTRCNKLFSDANGKQTTTAQKVKLEKMPFPDVEYGKWYVDYVRYVSEKGLITGYANGNFGPNDTITRAQVATILYRMAGSPKVSGTSGLKDENTFSAWYKDAVIWASKNGIVTGYGQGENAGKFVPNNNVSREELMIMFMRYAKNIKKMNVTVNQSLTQFSDYKSAHNYALEGIKWAVNKGVVTGKTINSKLCLDPLGTATRAEMAKMIKVFSEL